MSNYSNVSEQDSIILRKLAEQQRNQRALKIKNRNLEQTHYKSLAESLSPITKKLDIINESTKQLGEAVKISDVEDGNTQRPAKESITATQSLRDTLTPMKRSKNFYKLEEKDNGKVFWNDVFIKLSGENRITIQGVEFEITPDIHTYFTNTKLTTKFLDNVEKETVFDILENFGFYDNIPKRAFNSVRMKEALYNLSKVMDKVRNPPLPTI